MSDHRTEELEAWTLGEQAAASLKPEDFEPLIKRASEDFYERLMLDVQQYLKDNAAFNIQAQIDVTERENASLRSQLSEKEAEIARMKEDREYIIGFNAGWEAHEEQVDGPPQTHKFWAPGEPDCPSEIKAGNGELHTLRCKVCGIDSPRDDRCRTALSKEGGR